jgi:hypothetical protein
MKSLTLRYGPLEPASEAPQHALTAAQAKHDAGAPDTPPICCRLEPPTFCTELPG